MGGTFTDLVALRDGQVSTAKVASTPDDQSDGVMRSLAAAGLDGAAIASLSHGTTVATNALLERRGARTALVTTAGFRDVVEIGRQIRPSLYDLTEDRPEVLVPRELRFTVRERVGPHGIIERLSEDDLRTLVADLKRAEVDAVAVCFLFSFIDPVHERLVGDAIREELPGVQVSLSSDVLPEFREFERFSTTMADAYLSPKLSAYLDNLVQRTKAAGVPAPLVMQSSGGVTTIEDAAENAATCVLSGPAGGVVGATFVAGLAGIDDFLTFDMGGTSTDVAPVVGGRRQITTDSVVGGVPVKLPMVDVHTVSAGGGSIAWVDDGGALRVGPMSAGAVPGPAAYGTGGGEPTVTDANLWLGYLRDGARLGENLTLSRDLAGKAIRSLGENVRLDADQLAQGITAVANAGMARALRAISVERGLDPRSFALVAFGGAGPLHACALAEELAMPRVVVPKAGGVLSALGLAISELRRDLVAAHVRPFGEAGEQVVEKFQSLEAQARAALPDSEVRRYADLRYKGQSFEITVPADDLAAIPSSFHEEHERLNGYRMADAEIHFVNLRVVALKGRDLPVLRELAASGEPAPREQRSMNFDGAWMQVPVFHRDDLGAGAGIEGPAVVEFAECTCIVRPSWEGEIDGHGNLILEQR